MEGNTQRSKYMVVVVFAIFFVMSLVTNILGPIVPDIISSYRVSLTAAAVLPFSFFVAYGVLSIPAGFFVARWREKKVILGCFTAALAGSLLIAVWPTYAIAVASLFVIGGSMAALQVAINPLLRTAGGEEHFAFNSAFAQLIFGIASFLSPHLYSYIVEGLKEPGRASSGVIGILSRVVPANLPWISMYWVFAVVIFGTALVLAFSRFPKVERKQDEESGTATMYAFLLRKPTVLLFFLSVFLYVGSEQGTADWISEFLWRYHHYDPHTVGSNAVAFFWGLMTVGCFIGMVLLKVLDSRLVLRIFSCGALVALTVGLFGSGAAAKVAFPCIGLCASVMWPIIISLGLNSILEYPGPLAGILCSGIMGGAFLPLLIGRLGDSFGLRTGMLVLYLSFGWVGAVSFWARPLIKNKTAVVQNA